LIAPSQFNDTFQLFDAANARIALAEDGIAWSSDINGKFANPNASDPGVRLVDCVAMEVVCYVLLYVCMLYVCMYMYVCGFVFVMCVCMYVCMYVCIAFLCCIALYCIVSSCSHCLVCNIECLLNYSVTLHFFGEFQPASVVCESSYVY